MTSLHVLDDPAARERIDPQGMLAAVSALPGQCQDAWNAAQDMDIPSGYSQIRSIAVLGMGGSAIAGDLWRVLLQRECSVPVFNVRQYDLPPYVDGHTLVIASSYSGNTEETLSAFNQALRTPAKKLVLTTGGKILTAARANGVPVFSYTFAGEPRAALGWGFMPLLAIGQKLGLTQGIERDVHEAITVMEALLHDIAQDVPLAENAAKQMALSLHERLPVIYCAGPLAEVAHRWKTQLNESSKIWCFYEELPELHHNATVGLELPASTAANATVVLLQSDTLIHRRVALRFEWTRGLLERSGINVLSVDARGQSALAQMMSLILFGDFVSGYLALLYEVDPTPTAVIQDLRNWLSAQA